MRATIVVLLRRVGGRFHHGHVADTGQGFQLCLGQQLLQGQQARAVEHAVAVAPQREHGVLLQIAQPLF